VTPVVFVLGELRIPDFAEMVECVLRRKMVAAQPNFIDEISLTAQRAFSKFGAGRGRDMHSIDSR
jgi:hypothetical protein